MFTTRTGHLNGTSHRPGCPEATRRRWRFWWWLGSPPTWMVKNHGHRVLVFRSNNGQRLIKWFLNDVEHSWTHSYDRSFFWVNGCKEKPINMLTRQTFNHVASLIVVLSNFPDVQIGISPPRKSWCCWWQCEHCYINQIEYDPSVLFSVWHLCQRLE